MKIWNKIKMYWFWIVGGIISVIAIISAFGGLFKRKKSEKIQEKIDDNEKKIERVKGKEDQLKTQKILRLSLQQILMVGHLLYS